MRIIHFINNVDWAGGVETYVLNLIPILHAHGVEQSIVCCKRNDRVKLPVRYIRYDKSNFDALIDEIDLFNPDLIHIHNIFNINIYNLLLKRFRLVFTTHGYQLICPAQDFYLERPRSICNISCSWNCIPTTLLKKCMSMRPGHAIRSYKLADWAIRNRNKIAHLISPCTYAAKRHIAAGYEQDKVSILPYFCSLKPLSRPRPIPEIPTITFLGRIRPYKGVDYFVRILSELPTQIRGQIVGDVNDRSKRQIEELAVNLKVNDRLTLRSWVGQSELKAVFEETSVFVFPSIWPETLGIVGLEALSFGVPVVGFDVGGVEEWLIPNETGILVPVKDYKTAAAGIEGIIFDNSELFRMGERGIEHVKSHFSPEEHVKRLLDIYNRIGRN